MEQGSLRNCLIYGNSAYQNGGGVHISYYSTNLLVMENCTVANNETTYRQGGGIFIYCNNVHIQNTISYFNRSGDAYSNLYLWNYDTVTSSVSLTNCCIAPTNLTGITNSTGNIDSNPQFVDTNSGNYRLSAGSPCINSGTNQDWMASSSDLDGHARILYGTVDIGAYETLITDLSPTAATNTVLRGGATNFTVYLSNTNFDTLYWQAVSTNAWVTLSASNGTIASNTISTVIISNSAAALAVGTHNSRLTVYLTNAVYNSTGTVDMTLKVSEFGCSATTMTATVKQSGTAGTNISIWNAGVGILAYTVSTDVSWLVVSPVSGTLTGQTADATNELAVVITNTASLPVGTHYGALTLAPAGIAGDPLPISVILTVTNGPPMVVSPLILTGAVMMGQNFASQTVRVSNGSSVEQIGYGVTTNQGWVSVSPTNGTLGPGETNEVVVSYQASGLTTNSSGPSNYNATITVTATNSDALGSPANVAVSLRVNPKSRLNLSSSSLTNIVTEGYDAPDCAFEVWNGNGYYTLSYTMSDNADWLLMTPSSGTSTGEHDVITVEFSTAGFRAGVSNALITVVGRAYDGTHYDSALEATQTVAVSLMIIPATELATDALSSYEFSARLGRPAGSASFHLWNASDAGSVLRYTIATNASWLKASPVTGTSAGPDAKSEITLTCNANNLRPGRYSGAVTISGTDQSTGNEAVNSPVNINVALTILGEKGFDFGGDGNGASDLIVYQASSGLWNITNLYSGYTTNVIFGGQGYVPVPGDFDGDGVSDLGAYRYASGYWYARPITNQIVTAAGGSYWAGPALASLGGYVPVGGDYDGDGKTDPAMYCELSGIWSALFSASGYAYVSAAFGGPGYTAIPADYDGDGKTDPAVYNETTAQWYLLYSSDNYRVISGTFGGPGFTAAPADYDGDGKADTCIYKEATGLWVILPSSTLTPSGYTPVTGMLGGPGFNPVPADYNGDGLADVCVYEEALGNWYIVSINGTVIAWPAQHGAYGFAPVKP